MFFFKQKKSITARCIGPGQDIYITNDERFTGSDNCKDCSFKPCKINKWYGKRKSIENCKMYNKFKPTGKIVDQR